LVNKAPLDRTNIIQIGPYILEVNRAGRALSITVERKLEVQPLEARGGAGAGDVSDATMMIRVVSKSARPRGTQQVSYTELLAEALPSLERHALDIFWEKRKREAGKIDAETPLHPKTSLKVGKAQRNWRPNLDLRRLWRKSYFSWGVVTVFSLAVAAFYLYDQAYSPGPLSTAHTLDGSSRDIALHANASSCSGCHALPARLEDNCASCHTTQNFQPAVYEAHAREGVGCVACHTEHQGPGSESGLLSYGVCANCHDGGYTIKTGDRAGTRLATAHGGEVGHPVVNGRWEWTLSAEQLKRRGLPEKWAAFDSNRQFHAVHQMGRMAGRTSCGDCHTAGTRGDSAWRESTRAECSKCHATRATVAGSVSLQANCNTCHQQHGQSRDLARAVTDAGVNDQKLKDYFASLDRAQTATNNPPLATARLFEGTGPATRIRQDRDVPVLTGAARLGALPWYAWAALAFALPLAVVAAVVIGSARLKRFFKQTETAGMRGDRAEARAPGALDLNRLAAAGPAYPHPVIDPTLCIGCHACVEACPHDVLAIVNGIATPVALDQCMEDTSCQVECPTNPKACIVVNTKKVIPARKVPARDQSFMTNVEGIYLIGDVSGVPLIKNAVNEGGQVIDHIIRGLGARDSKAQYDVAIIGLGPAGLSAAIVARKRSLRYVAIEQDRVVSTIENYPAGKYIFFKPDTVEAAGGIPLAGAGEIKESLLESWMEAVRANELEIHDEESCKSITREGSVFQITTERGKLKQKSVYTARAVVLAIGNRGTPMKLRVPGEELKIWVGPETVMARHCPRCGAEAGPGPSPSCTRCGGSLPVRTVERYEDSKVKYKLSDPDDYQNKKIIVVGAGNSAIEAAVGLTGYRRQGDRISFTRDNQVTLVIRSDFKADLKLGNKMNVYDCIDAGRINVYFKAEVKEIREREVVLMNVKTKQELAVVANDYVFAMIGGEKPTRFLEGLGIRIG
ncbi:MAG TPA: NAD(P)-binding domain-containing protein, partial [Blastocatellia bacterium]|nr:NAD(P)-binding domain-containing protein [Blastocatellia bacterium]